VFQVVETLYDFTEKVIHDGVATPEDAQDIAKNRMRLRIGNALRVYWRRSSTVLTTIFSETERQVILVVIQELLEQKVDLTPKNLYSHVERIVVCHMEHGAMPWADPDMVGSALVKMQELTAEQYQDILREIKNG